MGQSPLVGIDRAAVEPAGRDAASLGPSDTSDSGSDLAGIERLDVNDPTLPVDVAMRDDVQRSPVASEIVRERSTSDGGGTGERRSAASDDVAREADDISVDRIFDPSAGAGEDEDEDPDLAFLDGVAAAPDPMDGEDDGDDEIEAADETAGGVGGDSGGRSGAGGAVERVNDTAEHDVVTDRPDDRAPEPRREKPATGIASHGAATSRKL